MLYFFPECLNGKCDNLLTNSTNSNQSRPVKGADANALFQDRSGFKIECPQYYVFTTTNPNPKCSVAAAKSNNTITSCRGSEILCRGLRYKHDFQPNKYCKLIDLY